MLWDSFTQAFEQQNTLACGDHLLKERATDHLHSWNFGASDPLDHLNRVLASDAAVVLFDANEWPEPQWPAPPILHALFTTVYRWAWSCGLNVPPCPLFTWEYHAFGASCTRV